MTLLCLFLIEVRLTQTMVIVTKIIVIVTIPKTQATGVIIHKYILKPWENMEWDVVSTSSALLYTLHDHKHTTLTQYLPEYVCE